MANAAALIRESLWRDKDFRQLPRLAQCMYMQLLSQKDLDCSGVLTLHLELLAKGCDEMSVDDIRGDLKTLESARYIFVDEEADELLIRSYVRLVSAKSPNAWKSVFKSARLVASPKIRRELANELRRLNRRDATELAEEIDPGHNPLEPHRNPIPTASERDNPSGPHSEPPRSVPVVVNLTSGNTQVGEDRPQCSRHQENFDGPCLRCKARREWDEHHAARLQADELTQRRRLRSIADNCETCHGTNWIPDTEPAVKCLHRLEASHG
jgi:hypothetical protein